jgi:hypothetical protein
MLSINPHGPAKARKLASGRLTSTKALVFIKWFETIIA